MDYTTNYHLPQWVESDRIMMEDFNEAMAGIDTGIKNAQDTADGGAAAAGAAQTTANRAESKADAAQASADAAGNAAADLAAIAYTTENKPFVAGSYTGNGSSTYRTINLGFRPRAVIIALNEYSAAAVFPNLTSPIAAVSASGFSVTNAAGYSYNTNKNNTAYAYLALK